MAVTKSLKLNTGHEMPTVGLGTWKSKKGEVQAAVKCAIDCGYRHIDCAWIYQNENEVGTGISSAIQEGTVTREDLFITSKLWNTYHRKEDVRPALMETLKLLQTEYLDLYLIHWPFGYVNNGEVFPTDKDGNILYDDVHYIETWKAMEELVKERLVRSIGVSNYNKIQLQRLLDEGSIPPAVNQVELHPYLTQPELVEFCQSKKIIVTAYSPLGSPDRPWAKKGEPVLMEDPKLLEIGKRLKKTVAQILLRFQLQRGLVVIPKSVTPSRIQSNFDLFNFELTKEDMNLISNFDRHFRGCVVSKDTSHKYFPFQENYSEKE